jgi:hypothetical protein
MPYVTARARTVLLARAVFDFVELLVGSAVPDLLNPSVSE